MDLDLLEDTLSCFEDGKVIIRVSNDAATYEHDIIEANIFRERKNNEETLIIEFNRNKLPLY